MNASKRKGIINGEGRATAVSHSVPYYWYEQRRYVLLLVDSTANDDMQASDYVVSLAQGVDEDPLTVKKRFLSDVRRGESNRVKAPDDIVMYKLTRVM